MQSQTYLSFWHIDLANLPIGTFTRRVLSTAEARSVVDSARASGTLLCVAKDDLAAPYREHERERHEQLCTALRDHRNIDVQLEDFFGGDCVNPLCIAEVGEKRSLLIVDCRYAFDDEIRPDTTAADTLVDETPKARARRLMKNSMRMNVDRDSIKFYVFEQVKPPHATGVAPPTGSKRGHRLNTRGSNVY